MRFDIYSSDSIRVILGMDTENFHTTLPRPGDLVQMYGAVSRKRGCGYVGIVILAKDHVSDGGRIFSMVKVMWAEE